MLLVQCLQLCPRWSSIEPNLMWNIDSSTVSTNVIIIILIQIQHWQMDSIHNNYTLLIYWYNIVYIIIILYCKTGPHAGVSSIRTSEQMDGRGGCRGNDFDENELFIFEKSRWSTCCFCSQVRPDISTPPPIPSLQNIITRNVIIIS